MLNIREIVLPYVVAVLGIFAVVMLSVAPTEKDTTIALVFLPGSAAGQAMHNFAEHALPIRDIRWRGRLVEFDISTLASAERKGILEQLSFATIPIAVRSGALCNTRNIDRGTL